ncbi:MULTISPECIES: hypothetical protein [Halococcus]|uniref:hypothetical protein n=1 Tax=Halococcus TaxID=2249 RepID=UPI000E71ACC0|nr:MULTISPECIES: hypothetical protein [Halococcus]RJT04109.1 hypothetical protein D3261_10075 [Halococcus sp. IIIV-5B]
MVLADVVFVSLTTVQIVALIPTLRDTESRIPRLTSGTAAFVWFAYSLTYLTMGLVFAAVSGTVGALMWAYILLKKPTVDDIELPSTD